MAKKELTINETILVPLDDFISLDATREDGSSIVEHGVLGLRKIDEKWVDTLSHTDHKEWPKVIVVQKPEGYVLVDGYHRRDAAYLKNERINHPEKGAEKVPDNGTPDNPIHSLPVEVRTFDSDIEIVKFAHEANNKHGLPPTPTSRTQYGLILLVEMEGKGETLHFTDVATKVGISKVTLWQAWKREEAKAKKASSEEGEKEEETLTDEEKAIKRFVSSLRTFYDKTVVDFQSNHEVSTLLASFLTKDDDKGMIVDLAEIIKDTEKMVNKPSKKPEAPTAKKTSKKTEASQPTAPTAKKTSKKPTQSTLTEQIEEASQPSQPEQIEEASQSEQIEEASQSEQSEALPTA